MLLLILPIYAHAGGDATLGIISQFSGHHGVYQFTVTQKDRLLYADNCKTYRVMIHPTKTTFWERFFPYLGIGGLSSSHPTPTETDIAAQALRQVSEQKQLVNLGYIGGGLSPDKYQKCLYHGTGIRREEQYFMIYLDGRRELYSF